ncbi:hypothetical protein K227x_41670 [Rubripirellula lacrimiformis]|uniref:Uncharacterized protein n=1 Tax=Rubripirellula lacrimiformis TaxID=1930273 RepID=A0A517NF56_9BACT|nr:hypothetical protein K227x_41670 [Rubripirellula lacrimiformis]
MTFGTMTGGFGNQIRQNSFAAWISGKIHHVIVCSNVPCVASGLLTSSLSTKAASESQSGVKASGSVEFPRLRGGFLNQQAASHDLKAE